MLCSLFRLIICIWWCSLITAGCAHQANSSGEPFDYAHAGRLFLRSRPYDRILVEVDVQDGVKVQPEWLDALETFLGEYCDKPGDIVIRRDAPFTTPPIEGLTRVELAMLCLDGPRCLQDGQADCAYLHVLFYDSSRLGMGDPVRPHVPARYPCEIRIDVAYVKKSVGTLCENLVRHEAGHVLGLCRNANHGDGVHCNNPHCLMHGKMRTGWWRTVLGVPVPKKELCDECRNDLRAYKESDDEHHLFFSGPLLVRRTRTYWVVYSPMTVTLVVHEADVLDWSELLAYQRQLITNKEEIQFGVIHASWWPGRREGMLGVQAAWEAIQSAFHDPDPLVQKAAQLASDDLAEGLQRH